MRRVQLLSSAASLAAALLAASAAQAGGFYVQEQSAKGLGRAYSGEAADTGADSLWWNPAAIGSITGREIYSGLHIIDVEAGVSDTGSTLRRPTLPGVALPVGGEPRAYNPVKLGVVPNLAAAWRVNDRIAVGLAVNAPFDFITRYSSSSWTRYSAIKSRLLNIDVQPTVAIHVNDKLDLGAGLDISYADATLTNALPNLSPALPDGRQDLRGDGWDLGYVVGAQYRPVRRLTLAASYRSKIDHELDGRVRVNALAGTPAAINLDTPGVASFSTPWIATFGARYALTDRLTLNAQVQRLGWSEFDAIRVTYTGGGSVTPQGYEDVTNVSLGADYAVTPDWTVRAGVQVDETPTPDVGRTARVPDGDRVLIGAGTSFKVGPRLSFDLAGGYIHFDDSRINSTETAFPGTAAAIAVSNQGRVEGAGYVLSAGAHLRF